jgi:hypothetical protein
MTRLFHPAIKQGERIALFNFQRTARADDKASAQKNLKNHIQETEATTSHPPVAQAKLLPKRTLTPSRGFPKAEQI